MSKWIESLDKFGAVGSAIAALCCLGFGPLLAVFTAIGAGFLINDKILLPLLIVFLILGGWGILSAARRLGKYQAFWLHLISSVLLIVTIFLYYQKLLVWLALGGIVLAPLWSFFIKRSCEIGGQKKSQKCT